MLISSLRLNEWSNEQLDFDGMYWGLALVALLSLILVIHVLNGQILDLYEFDNDLSVLAICMIILDHKNSKS